MAITIGAAAAVQKASATFESVTGDNAVKTTLIGGSAIDADLIAYFEDMDTLSNARMLNPQVAGRLIAGHKGAASANSQNLVSVFMQLNFSQVNPINTADEVERSWLLPAPVEALRGSGNTPVIAAAGTGSVAARVGRLVSFLVDNLAFKAADGSYVVGGWTYNGGAFGSGADFVDGE